MGSRSWPGNYDFGKVRTARSLALLRARAGGTERQLKVATAGRRSTKKQQSGPPNAVRIEGHVMPYGTDIAGGSIGQTRPGIGMCCRAPNGAPHLENNPSSLRLLRLQRLVMTPVPADHAVYLEPFVLEPLAL
jgi:hypothetical protein